MKETYLLPEDLKKDFQFFLEIIEENQKKIFKAMMMARNQVLIVKTLEEKYEFSQLALNYQEILNESRKKLRHLLQDF